MKIEDCGLLDEIFSHDDREGGIRHFNATAMFNYAMTHKNEFELLTCNLDADHAKRLRTIGGIEQWKVDRLTDPHIDKPILIIFWQDGTHVIVDGNHRFVKKFERGDKTINAIKFTLSQAEPFMVHMDAPIEFQQRLCRE